MIFRIETFRMCVNVFYTTRNEISVGSDKKWEIFPWTPIIKITHFCNVTSQKVGDFHNGGLWGNFSFFVGSNWNFVPGYIKNVDTHHESFSSKNQVIKKLSTKSLWQTYMKWTVVQIGWNCTFCYNIVARRTQYVTTLSN